jgi:hypothetical protein
MNRLRNFLRLSSSDRRLLISAALLLGAIVLGLWLLPFLTLQRLLGNLAAPRTSRREAEAFSADRVVWAVTVASRYVPGASTCLTQALAAQVLLARRGEVACLRIGVARREGRFQAHAWLESQGKVIFGGSELGRYAPLPALDGEKR